MTQKITLDKVGGHFTLAETTRTAVTLISRLEFIKSTERAPGIDSTAYFSFPTRVILTRQSRMEIAPSVWQVLWRREENHATGVFTNSRSLSQESTSKSSSGGGRLPSSKFILLERLASL